MGRLNREVAKQREEEAVAGLLTGSSVKEVNEALKLKYGKKMGLKKIYELKKAVKEAQVLTPDVANIEVPPEDTTE